LKGHIDLRCGLFSVVLEGVANTLSHLGDGKMLRSSGVVLLLIVCSTALSFAQAPQEKEQDRAGQTPSGKQTTAPAAADVAAKSQYPLDEFQNFSALVTGSRMGVGDEAHIYRSGKLMRVEGPESRGYFVTDLQTLETWGITTTGCAHDARHPYFRTAPFPAAKPGTKVERVVVGKETFEGHSCQIEDVTITPTLKGAPPLKMRLWEAEDLQGFPVKIEFPASGGKKSPTIRYRNVVLGPQDPTLFIYPKSCGALPTKEDADKPEGAKTVKKPAPSGAKN
jgi:hypothetical protein